MVINVYDLRLAGRVENMAEGWELLGNKSRSEPGADLGLYLGCMLSKGGSKLNTRTS